VLRRFPFDPRSATEAQPADVAQIFQPGTSALWAFYQANLSDMLVRQGEGYGPAPGSPRQPTRAFTTFFNRAAEVSRALFDEQGAGPQVDFELRPEPTGQITQIRIDIDGQVQTITPTERATRTFRWEAANGRSARIVATINGREITVAAAQGPWAAFRLFHAADPAWERLAAGHYRLRWRVP
jgi:type VI secretion system protein ImpL